MIAPMMQSRRNRARHGCSSCPFYCCTAQVSRRTLRSRERAAWKRENA